MTEYTVQIEDRQLRELQLGILRTVADFCDERGIAYWLDFGTLIGAVRHKGYIPWDDDIDVGMLREDYDRFAHEFNSASERYEFRSYETDKSFDFAFGKVLDKRTVLYEPDRNGIKLAVNIDIFPYDNAPSDPKKAAGMYKKRNRLNIMEVARKHSGKARGGLLRRAAVSCLSCFARMFPRGYFLKRIVRNAKKYAHMDSGFVGDFCGNETSFVTETSKYKSFVECEFEGETFKIPAAYDDILTTVYGDYMTPPPEDQRVSHHRYEAYLIENSME